MYAFEITCPHCAGPVEALEIGVPTVRRTAALVECLRCRAVERVAVILARVRTPTIHVTDLSQDLDDDYDEEDDAPPRGIPRPQPHRGA